MISKAFIRQENNERARRALEVLKAYEKANDPGCGVETALSDLLTDLMHWGSRKRRHGTTDKFEVALDKARGYFAAEEAMGSAI